MRETTGTTAAACSQLLKFPNFRVFFGFLLLFSKISSLLRLIKYTRILIRGFLFIRFERKPHTKMLTSYFSRWIRKTSSFSSVLLGFERNLLFDQLQDTNFTRPTSTFHLPLFFFRHFRTNRSLRQMLCMQMKGCASRSVRRLVARPTNPGRAKVCVNRFQACDVF